MAQYSENQVRHFYVVTATGKSAADMKTNAEKANPEVGWLSEKQTIQDGSNNGFYFLYQSPGGLIRTDIVTNVISSSFTKAENMVKYLKTTEITLNSDINNGNPVIGQDYILRFKFKNYIVRGEASQYDKFAVVRVLSNDPSKFYKEMAKSIYLNFKREPQQIITVHLYNSTKSETEQVTDANFDTIMSSTDTFTKIIIKEGRDNNYRRGINKSSNPLNFRIYSDTITINGVEQHWSNDIAAPTPSTDDADVIYNTNDVKDMEWFFMGERGDTYRGAGYPNNVVTTYVTDSIDAPKGYDFSDCHYAFTDYNEGVQKSEKTITFVAKSGVITSNLFV